ncbi:hypothetical protein SRABI83_01918 [Arthrobacter sp. Bi83]|nr:hypothetical protein SRABI83_01918 [Arthrobacter sp. Bi83]
MDINRQQTETPGMLEVHAKHAYEVDDALTKAIDVVKIAATEHKTGILISRIDTGRYIVRAHPAVPFGLVRQRHEPLDGRQNGTADD